jgi:hypothetical protein
MLLAVSDTVVTGGAAVFGALVGAATGGLVDAALDRRRERARAKAGARLVGMDLLSAAAVLKSIEDDAMWFSFQELSMVAWPEYRDVLAVRLANEQFEQVSAAVIGVDYLMTGARMMFEKQQKTLQQLSPAAVKRVRKARSDMTAAYNALAKLARRARVEDHLLGD